MGKFMIGTIEAPPAMPEKFMMGSIDASSEVAPETIMAGTEPEAFMMGTVDAETKFMHGSIDATDRDWDSLQESHRHEIRLELRSASKLAKPDVRLETWVRSVFSSSTSEIYAEILYGNQQLKTDRFGSTDGTSVQFNGRPLLLQYEEGKELIVKLRDSRGFRCRFGNDPKIGAATVKFGEEDTNGSLMQNTLPLKRGGD